ncbi:MAG TPA: hypothetical protein VL916_01285, partial [Ilumatobacteraceae bacterium]|nr:hypothetical protein [Ilumatobacteraceae bacterium]
RRVNINKSDHLAAAEHVVQWQQRNQTFSDELTTIAAANRWESAPTQTVGVARALYFVLGTANLLWSSPNTFVAADVQMLRTALAA